MDFEKLGVFYLGKLYDLENDQQLNHLAMYDARDLTTHAVCVGMTGSGKTGLCIDLLEEAAIDLVPAIIIDPKGDITNLLLTFPDLSPEDFRPWINVDDARRKGVSEEVFAAQQAQIWREGLATWGQDSERIRMLRASADFVIYTPGSDAGIPVSILQSFSAPALNWDTEAELLRERIQGIVSALLGLVGLEADPVRSREHILLAHLFEHFWRQGEDLDLSKVILSIQDPPIRQLGVFDIDTFFPPKDRFELAMSLNNIIAAPAFQSWLHGQSMDIPGFLSSANGKPRHSIFYIAHLSESERMFFVTMLLNQLIGWMRAQPGTTSLRALLYMDEVFGFFPPVANPPSKKPLLTLMKQGRAFGMGVLLATQNPADLDYKGLTNAGTWFIGRLQTERDKERVLEGLESASAQVGGALDRKKLDKILSGLGKRVFLLHDVHESFPVIFQTRWAMSYLRGPLTRLQVRTLMQNVQSEVLGEMKSITAPSIGHVAAVRSVPTGSTDTDAAVSMSMSQPVSVTQNTVPAYHTVPSVLPEDIRQVYLPLRKGVTLAEQEIEQSVSGTIAVQARHILYVPALLGMGWVHFVKQRKDLDVNEASAFALLAQPPRGVGVLRWEQAQILELLPRDLLDRPEPQSYFDEVPESITQVRTFTAYKGELEDYLYRTQNLTLLYSPMLKVYSRPGESQRDFRMRLTQIARELRDAELDQLKARYGKQLDTLEERLRRAQAMLDKKEANARARKQQALITTGEMVLGIFSRRRRSVSIVANRYSQSSTAQLEVEAAGDQVEVLQEDIQELQQELKAKTDDMIAQWETALETFEEFSVHPRRMDVEVTFYALVWVPHWRIDFQQRGSGVLQTEIIPAY
ncbi:MAG: hypothetical protein JXA33_21535 [Anaerolineae bacterium]|nr:hypothetical protein [Anaerolineae bacterium]